MVEAVRCPECGSDSLYKDGLRYTNFRKVQRYLCRFCGYRFSQSNIKVNVAEKVNETLNSEKDNCKVRVASRNFSVNKVTDSLSFFYGENVASHDFSIVEKLLNNFSFHSGKRQVCAKKDAKNLDSAQELEKICAGDGNLLNYAWLLKKRGLADNTINLRVSTLRLIQKKGVNLKDTDSVETLLATENLTKARKWQFVTCYKSYTKIMKIPWGPIRVKYEPKQVFLPTREEMNALVHAGRKWLATFLQTALTTGARVGELCKLKWTDIDTEKNRISINDAEKGSRNRTIKGPRKTIAMINAIPKKDDTYIFNTNSGNVRVAFHNLRKRLASTQNNPRFLKIHLHTFRHFYATETLRRTKNLSYVKYALGHKTIMNTERYTHLVDFGSDKYYSAVATTVEEGRKLAEDGWTYFQEFEGVKVFRKPI